MGFSGCGVYYVYSRQRTPYYENHKPRNDPGRYYYQRRDFSYYLRFLAFGIGRVYCEHRGTCIKTHFAYGFGYFRAKAIQMEAGRKDPTISADGNHWTVVNGRYFRRNLNGCLG